MKFKKQYIGLALLPMLASCADYLDTENYIVEKPASIADYEYLDAYKPLKEYVNHGKHPGFTLGTGVSVDDYLKLGDIYHLTNTNFDMMTAGNAMKYASCVDDNGNLKFAKVTNFVEAAQNAGMQIYGHTLCWHSQQNVKWLNSVIADVPIEVDPSEKVEVVDLDLDFSTMSAYTFWHQPDSGPAEFSIEDGCLKIVNPEAVNFWEVQYFTFDNVEFKAGREYKITVVVKATQEGNIKGNAGGWSDNAPISIPYYTDWSEQTISITAANDGGSHGLFQTGDLAGTIWYKSIKITHSEAPVMEKGVSLIDNGDADNGQSEYLIAREIGNDDIPARIVDDPAGTGKVFECTYNADPGTPWDSQFFIKSQETLEEGTKIHVKFRYRTTDSRNIETQAHGNPGSYHHYQCIGVLNATTDWKEHEYTGVVSSAFAGSEGFISIAFNLCGAAAGGTFYIDDVVFEKIVPANTIELTPEEKYEAIDGELKRWIYGMVNATGGYVKAWDVVNEPLSDQNNCVDLKHKAVEADPQSFYWQDYLGDDYVRLAVKYAREAYADIDGTNPDDLKLFVNDYGLEGNGSVKVESLINWINRWESDGVTKIDGIGTQMHVTYATDPEAQARNEQGVVDMLKKLAATGKLIRITELDMGIKSGDHWSEEGRKTETLTVEEHKAMGEYYRFIVNQYFKLIPEAQQFGICHWSQTDSPENSGWRKGEPIGLWNLNTQRKPAYGGFADGLGEN